MVDKPAFFNDLGHMRLLGSIECRKVHSEGKGARTGASGVVRMRVSNPFL